MKHGGHKSHSNYVKTQKLIFFMDRSVYDAVLFSDKRTEDSNRSWMKSNHFGIKIVPCKRIVFKTRILFMQDARQILVGKSFSHLSQGKVPEILPCSELSRATQGSNSYWIFIAEKVCQPSSQPASQPTRLPSSQWCWIGKYKQALGKRSGEKFSTLLKTVWPTPPISLTSKQDWWASNVQAPHSI